MLLRRLVVVREDASDVSENGKFFIKRFSVSVFKFETFSPSQQRPVLEHGDGLRMEGPVGALAGPVGPPWDLDEAIVKAEIVAK